MMQEESLEPEIMIDSSRAMQRTEPLWHSAVGEGTLVEGSLGSLACPRVRSSRPVRALHTFIVRSRDPVTIFVSSKVTQYTESKCPTRACGVTLACSQRFSRARRALYSLDQSKSSGMFGTAVHLLAWYRVRQTSFDRAK